MKKIIKIIILVIVTISFMEVKAENYKVKELIPLNVKTTIHTDHFSYIEMYANQKNIYFNSVLNTSDETRPITISIGLFDNNGKNIGTINDCSLNLKSKERVSYKIDITSDYFGKDKSNNDIKYISVLSENINCRRGGSKDYIGKTVDNLGITHTEVFTSDTSIAIMIFSVLGGIILIIFLYKLFFTNKYTNIDGNAVRKAYKSSEDKFNFIDNEKK